MPAGCDSFGRAGRTDRGERKETPDAEEPAVPLLTIERFIPVPRQTLWRCWIEPELIGQWACAAPWRMTQAVQELRPGGLRLVVMQGPRGQEMAQRGVYLDVVGGRRLVFTDAFVRAWVPSDKAATVTTVSFANQAGGTQYRVDVAHWTAAERAQQEAGWFDQGWGAATERLAVLAARL